MKLKQFINSNVPGKTEKSLENQFNEWAKDKYIVVNDTNYQVHDDGFESLLVFYEQRDSELVKALGVIAGGLNSIEETLNDQL